MPIEAPNRAPQAIRNKLAIPKTFINDSSFTDPYQNFLHRPLAIHPFLCISNKFIEIVL
jgi:hypothetical protein